MVNPNLHTQSPARVIKPVGSSQHTHDSVASDVPNGVVVEGLFQEIAPALSISAAVNQRPQVNQTKIYHPRLAPSSVATEQILEAKSLLMPLHVHNTAHTKSARISNYMKDPPRFSQLIDLLA